MSIHKSTSLFIAAIFSTTMAYADIEHWTFSTEADAHNMLMFSISHQGFSNSIGFFTEFAGDIYLDEDNLENSSVSAEIDISSIDIAQLEVWNNNTLNTFFDIAEFPSMTFHSTSVEDLGDGNLQIVGDLSLMGITREVSLDARLNRIGQYMDAGRKAGFSAYTKINRTNWGIDELLDLRIGDEVAITIEIESFPADMEVAH